MHANSHSFNNILKDFILFHGLAFYLAFYLGPTLDLGLANSLLC